MNYKLSQICLHPNPNTQPTPSNPSRFLQDVLFFPQMKPEQKAAELSEDEKVVMSILKDHSPIDLNELKEQSGLSNKKWDKAIKGLTKNKLAKVEICDEDLSVSLV